MNALGLSLMLCTVPATLFAATGIAVYLLVRRAGPAIGALSALTTLLVLAGVSLLALGPWPRWWTLEAPSGAARPSAHVADADAKVVLLSPESTEATTAAARSEETDDGTAAPNATAVPYWQPWLDEMQPQRARLADGAATWHWPALMALVFISGVGLALLRLALGLWTVHRYRATSSAITDPVLQQAVQRIAAEFGLRRPIELRASPSLTTAATVGWLRPLVLLPASWKSWSLDERRAVVAHEIAHIARGDYPAWLLAQISLALHFYHPLVHWLVRRLRLEQELAADLLGAELAGGREAYLVTLTEMVLRQDAPRVGWLSRPFLSARATFVKRIAVLSAAQSLSPNSWSKSRMAILAGVLVLLGVASAGIRLPDGAVRAQEEAAGDKSAGHAPPRAVAPFDAQQAKEHQQAWARHLGVPVEFVNSLGMKFVLIPPGEFTMGATAEEIEEHPMFAVDDKGWRQRFASQVPRHRVMLTKAFYLSVDEVTQAEYEKVIGENPSAFSPGGSRKDIAAGRDTSRYPVELVTWNNAAEFCAKLSELEKRKPFYDRQGDTFALQPGAGYRLPTEAEWEFACRAGTTTKYWPGDRPGLLDDTDWLAGNSHYRGTRPVGQGKPNPFGLEDMHGNVTEWVQDAWDGTYYGQFGGMAAIDPAGPPLDSTRLRVTRGGSWYLAACDCRSADRQRFQVTERWEDRGFRIALSPVAVLAQGAAEPKRVSPKRDGDGQAAAEQKQADKPRPAGEIRPHIAEQLRSIHSLYAEYTVTDPMAFGAQSHDFVWAEQGEKLLKRAVPSDATVGYASGFDGERFYVLPYVGDRGVALETHDQLDPRFYFSLRATILGWFHFGGGRATIAEAISAPQAKFARTAGADGMTRPTIEVPGYVSPATSAKVDVTIVLDPAHGDLPQSIAWHGVKQPDLQLAYEVLEFQRVRDGATGKDRWFPLRGRYVQRTSPTEVQVWTTKIDKLRINEKLPDELFVIPPDDPSAPGG